MRLAIQEFMRACNDLAGSVRENNGALTNEECDTVRTCMQTLQTTVLPIKPMMARLWLERSGRYRPSSTDPAEEA